MKKVKIGIGQFSSIHLDLQASLDKLEKIILLAAAQKVDLLVLGETWLSGYPAWLDHCPDVARWNNLDVKNCFLKLYNSSISIDGPELKLICSWVKRSNLTLCLGINEKVANGIGQGTIFNSVLIIDAEGNLQNHHRKLVPTFTEKMLYGFGDAAGLKSVDTPYGKIGASICWEHWMPLTRQALHDSGEHIHIALWPTVHEMHQIACRQYAFEGRCFVIAVGQLLKASDFPIELEKPTALKMNPDQLVLRGGSCFIDPTGSYVIEPFFDKEELLLCEVDTDQTIMERMTLDTSGHYQRRDIFSFDVNRKRD